MLREELKIVSVISQCCFLFGLLNFPVILLLTKATALCIHLLIEGFRAKRAYIGFWPIFIFLQDRANFSQTDLF